MSQEKRMNNYLYVDNSNFWIEGKRVSAIKNGWAFDVWDSINNGIIDSSWSVDFGKLFLFAGGNKAFVKSAKIYGSRPPQNDSLWKAAERNNFVVKVFDRNRSNKEKKVDSQIVTDILADSYTVMDASTSMITLVAGDADYVPVIKNLKDRGFYVEVLFWNHASRELQQECSNFVALDDRIDSLSLS